MNELRERFLAVEHDFGEFSDPDGEYYRNERLYKDELRDLFRELLPESLFTGDPAERAESSSPPSPRPPPRAAPRTARATTSLSPHPADRGRLAASERRRRDIHLHTSALP